MKWIKVFDADIRLQTDFVQKIKVSGKKMCLIKSGEDFFATQVRCPHAGADLSNGWCEKGKLVCPFHRHEFDLRTGEGNEGQGEYINTYPTELRGDGLFVGVPDPWWKRLFG